MAISEISTGKDKEDDDGGATENEEAWGTWEELILVAAVNRYGANCWESIARELQRQTSTNNLYNSQACELKFGEIRRRFDAGEDADEEAVLRTMEEQLRRRRIEELKLEMKRRDSKIELLESNLQKLKEEEEAETKPEEEVDLVGDSDNRETVSNSAAAEEGNVAAVSATGDGGDDRANSTSRNQPESENETCELENRGITGPELLQSEPELGEVPPVQAAAPEPASPLALELTDSMAESNLTEPDQPKEQRSCEMQSQEIVKRRGINGEDDGAQPIAAATSEALLQPPTLIRVLELIRSKKNSSFFESRLPSQETKEYREVIKQHMDLKTVESNMNEGLYANSESRFFRDLLLIFSNFTVFYPKDSPEYVAAQEIRKIIIKEANPAKPKSKRIQPAPNSAVDNKEANPLIICRRRSSAYPTESLEAMSKQKESHQRHHHQDSKAAVTIKKDTEKRGRPPLTRKESRPTSIKTSKKRDLNEDDDEEEKLEGKVKNEGRSKTSQRTTRKMVRGRKREDSDEDDKGEDFETRVKRKRADNRVQERKSSVSKNKEQPQIKVTKEQSQIKVTMEDTRLSRTDNKVRNSEERKSVERKNVSRDKKGGEFQRRAKVEDKKASKGDNNVRERKDAESRVKTAERTSKTDDTKFKERKKAAKEEAGGDGHKISDRNSKNVSETDDADDEEELVKKVKRTGRPRLKSNYFRRMKVVMESSSEEEEEDVPEVKKRDTRRREEPKRDTRNHNEAGKVKTAQREQKEEKSIERRREKEKESATRKGDSSGGGSRRRGRPRKSSLPPPIVRDSHRVVAGVKREPEEEEDLPPPRKRGR